MDHVVYALVNKKGNIFYIGCTNSIEVRFMAHKGKYGHGITYKILERCSYSEALNKEGYWINFYQKSGVKLKNKKQGRRKVKDKKVVYAFTIEQSTKDLALKNI